MVYLLEVWDLIVSANQPLFRVAPREGWAAANGEMARRQLSFPQCDDLSVGDMLLVGECN